MAEREDGRGRPANAENPRITMTTEDGEKAAWIAAADRRGLSLRDWLRESANATARREQRRADAEIEKLRTGT